MTKFQILTHKPKIDKWIFGQNIDFWNSVLMLCLRKPCIFALVTVVHQSISFSAALFATSRELTSSPLLHKLHLLLLQTRIRKSDIPVDTDYNLEQHKRRRTAAKKSRFVTKVVISADQSTYKLSSTISRGHFPRESFLSNFNISSVFHYFKSLILVSNIQFGQNLTLRHS